MPQNRAAWLTGPQVYPLTVAEAPYPEPGPDQVVIRVAYTAMNPADWKIVKRGGRVTKFPMIIGQDVSGEVIEVGGHVDNVKIGSRVFAHVMAVSQGNAPEGGFQLYTVARKYAVCPIPENMTLEQASVLPLAVSTATVGLYTYNQLALPLPTLESEPKSIKQTILVWGGSSSVGGMVIQFAKLSGLRVAATCSPRNNEYVKSLGADLVFDYSSASVVDEIVSKLDGQEVVGIYNAIGGETSGNACVKVIQRVKTVNGRRHIATVPPVPQSVPDGVSVVALGGAGTMFFDDKRRETALYIWQEFLPQALIKGTVKAVPEALVVGEGLEKIQLALDTLEAGVSAKKVVVKLH